MPIISTPVLNGVPRLRYHVGLFGILIAVVALILYGSLFPWRFEFRALPASPLYILFHSWQITGGRRFIADVVVNLAIYIPLGITGFLAMRKLHSRRLCYIAPVILGGTLSGAIEMTQLFVPGRVCSGFDLVDNILGSAAGVIAGIGFEKLLRSRPQTARPRANAAALALLFCQAAALLFPFLPETSLHSWSRKISLFFHGPVADPVLFLSALAAWFASSQMIRRSGAGSPGKWIALSLLCVSLQVFVATRQPSPAELLGAIAGVACLLAADRIPRSALPAACLFLGVIALRGLAPFHFTSAQNPFLWIPFAGFLDMDWQSAIRGLLEKLFYYGAAIWLLRRAKVTWAVGIAIVCALLAAIEVAQIHLPGRTSEITDPLLALLLGLALRALARKQPVGYHAIS